MKRMIYQVCLGNEKKSKLYERCIESVRKYCDKHDIKHVVQTKPILQIKPDIFATNRSTESYGKHGGFLPIYEKENAFDLLDEYDQIAIVDADIYIRPDAPNIFEDFGTDYPFGAVVEMDMPINLQYMAKIKNYSHMQYNTLANNGIKWRYETALGFEFMNMGLILLNSKLFKPYLKGKNAKQWLEQPRFKDFVDGIGNWKWSTDQTLLNYWLRKDDVPFKRMDWKWNGLYTALQNEMIKEAHFVHFFLKDKLPSRGEDIDQLVSQI